MSRARIESLVALAERDVPRWRARALAEELAANLTRAHGIDAPLRARALVAIASLAPSLPVPTAPRGLARGSAHVLLAGPLGGETATVSAMRSGRAGTLETTLPSRARDAIRAALDGTIHVLTRAGCGLPSALELGFAFELDREASTIDGASLGLSVAIAMLSRELAEPIAPDVAGTAELRGDGQLAPVAGLAAKIEALRRDYPDVSRIVVAGGQELGDACGLEIVRVPDLIHALAAYGLRLDRARLGGPTRERLRGMLASFDSSTVSDWSSELWEELSAQASYVGDVLGPDSLDGASAYGWAALFAFHAGDQVRSARLRALVPLLAKASLPPRARIAFLIAEALGTVDRAEVGHAIAVAERAVALLEELHPADRLGLAGRAWGTLARVLVRAGRLEDALVYYRRAADHHRDHLPEGLPRSLCHVANVQRLLGRLDEARATIELSHAKNERFLHDSERAPVTRMFLRYEEGLVLLALGEPARAVHVLEMCADSQHRDHDWPRLGALAALIRAHLESGRPDLATRALDACAEVARGEGIPPRLARAAAVGIAGALEIAERAPWSHRVAELSALVAAQQVELGPARDHTRY